MNAPGWVTGYFDDVDGVSRAFLWRPNGAVTALPSPGATGSWANDINDRRQIVGTAVLGTWHAVVWTVPGSNAHWQ